jgi:hypothetical protein
MFSALAVVAVCALFAAAVAVSLDVDRNERSPVRFRLLVAVLHLVQPVARTWGRLSTPEPAVEPRPCGWTGDRIAWLRALVRESRSHRLSVRQGGATEGCDLHWTVGPFVEARVNTAVVWNWVPRFTVSYRLRATVAVLLVGVGVLAVLAPLAALVAATLAFAAVTVEGVRLRRRVSSALDRSIAGAITTEPEPST